MKVFVYGSLMRGYHNAYILSEAKFIGRGVVKGLLYDVAEGTYPGMIHGAGTVHGEVYEVDEETFARLDRLESFMGAGNPDNLYNRETVEVTLDTGETARAWAYIYNQEIAEVIPKELIPSGNWRDVALPMGYESVEVKGHAFVLTDIRELAAVTLEGYPFKYDIRHDDEEWEPCSIEKFGTVFVNWYGTLFSKEDVFPELKTHGDYIPLDANKEIYY